MFLPYLLHPIWIWILIPSISCLASNFNPHTDRNVDLYWGTRPARAAEDVDEDREVEVNIEGGGEGDVEVDINIEGDGDEDVPLPPQSHEFTIGRNYQILGPMRLGDGGSAENEAEVDVS
ncbi:hypothetical protein BT96DRAFT_945609 [Gymnopus androsaceus JB14]|uniref:Uncharacterized protein n=1 Tax=Gymnopus androsaceus JB14 TaxID=1447944 RepID=A0A6A4H0H1_9AGAR|nr:hypothetical protein BT96DRAFT_945609 [Gymnopus androsaceus JB14]